MVVPAWRVEAQVGGLMAFSTAWIMLLSNTARAGVPWHTTTISACAGFVHVETPRSGYLVTGTADGGQVIRRALRVEPFIIGQALELLAFGLKEHVGSISMAGRQAAESVVKNGLPVPAENHTRTAEVAAWRLAAVVVVGHTDHGIGRHHSRGDVEALAGIAHRRPFITVASIPMWSPVPVHAARDRAAARGTGCPPPIDQGRLSADPTHCRFPAPCGQHLGSNANPPAHQGFAAQL
ncbi:hypothetical protein FQR65_LT20586 [Abscondita terminalis]|nr:hypothetical protein FQR65_LT20586 [Abscondita terminalis]